MAYAATDVSGDPPPIPNVSRKEFADQRWWARDMERVFARQVGQMVTEHMAARWAAELATALYVSLSAAHATLLQLVGRPMTTDLARQLAWQMVVRADEYDDKPLALYERPMRAEWVPCEVQDVRPCSWRGGDDGNELLLFAFRGEPAGTVLSQRVPSRWLNGFAYQMGFTRRIIFDGDPRHFIGLRFWGYLQPQPDRSDVSFSSWELSNAFKEHNKDIIGKRMRFEVGEHRTRSKDGETWEEPRCPDTLAHLCWDCPKRRTECPASIRP